MSRWPFSRYIIILIHRQARLLCIANRAFMQPFQRSYFRDVVRLHFMATTTTTTTTTTGAAVWPVLIINFQFSPSVLPLPPPPPDYFIGQGSLAGYRCCSMGFAFIMTTCTIYVLVYQGLVYGFNLTRPRQPLRLCA